MRRKTLSDIGVANLKPRDKRYTYPDPELRGHYVRVMPSGAKSYAVVSRDPVSGKQVWAAVGNAEALKIDDARERARAALQRIREGKPALGPNSRPAGHFRQCCRQLAEAPRRSKEVEVTS